MSPVRLSTARLALRPLEHGDAAPITAALADPEVARWLTGVPEPYALSDAEAFLGKVAGKPGYWAICGPDLMGVVSLRAGLGLGYWLAREHWGQGLVPEAAEAVLAHHFGRSDLPVRSGHHPGNDRSRNVLLALGFRDSGMVEVSTVKAVGRQWIQQMQLTEAAWKFALDPRVETARLVVSPFTPGDAAEVSAQLNDPEIAPMFGSVPHPFPPEIAEKWLGTNRWRGRVGFRWGIRLKSGELIGGIGLGGNPVSTMYWIARAHWRQGYATEAMAAFLPEMAARLNLPEVIARVFTDNPGSAALLSHLGFVKTGEEVAQSKARLEPAPVFTYRKSFTGG